MINIRITSFLFFFVITMAMNLHTLRTQNGRYESQDVQVVHTSTRQILKLLTRTVELLTIPDGYSFYSYSSGQCCLQSIFNYYQFPNSPKPYKQDFFFNAADLDDNNFTTPAKLVQQAKLKLNKQASETQRYAFQITVQQNMRNLDIQILIDSQIPVILLINRGKSQKSASYVIAIGYDEENYYFEDPSTIRSITYLPKATLANIWNSYIQSENRWATRLGIVIKFQNGRKRQIVPTVRPLP